MRVIADNQKDNHMTLRHLCEVTYTVVQVNRYFKLTAALC